jgi:hypothetical protein
MTGTFAGAHDRRIAPDFRPAFGLPLEIERSMRHGTN